MSSQCQSGECNRKAFEMPSGCPPVEKPPIVDVQACELPPLVPTEFERHPLVVDLPSIPINVGCGCIDVETHMSVSDDRHTKNKIKFHQADGATDCCAGLYALDLQLNIPTCSTDPPNITGQGSRGITVSGKGIPRADEPCMFDLDMDITVPCPLEGITIGDGKGIAKIEKGPPPSFANCNLSFDVNVPCPLPGITFTVTGQASGSVATGGQKSVAADGNNSTVDSGGNGGGRIGDNTVLSVGRTRVLSASGASGGGGGAGGASGGGGGGDPCTLELKLNVPCQLPGVSFTVTGQASGGIKPHQDGSYTGADCKSDLEINVPCQLPNIKVLETIKPYSPTTQNPKISLKDAIRLLKATGASEECEAQLQIEADDVTIPCEKLELDLEGQISGYVTDSSDDCDKTLSLNVPCQLPNISVDRTERSGNPAVQPDHNRRNIRLSDAISIDKLDSSNDCSASIRIVATDIEVPCLLDNLSVDITGQASGDIRTDTTSSNDCAKQLTVDVPCQLDIIEVKDTVKPSSGPGSAGQPIVPAENNGIIPLSDAIKLIRDPVSGQHRSDSCDMSLQIVASDISVPCESLSTNPTGQVTASFRKDSSTGANPCDKVLDIDVPCQLPNVKVKDTTKPATGPGSHDHPIKPEGNDGRIELSKAISISRTSDPSGGCGMSLQVVASDVEVPCESLKTSLSGEITGGVAKDPSGSSVCDKVLSLTVPCQIKDKISVLSTSRSTGQGVSPSPVSGGRKIDLHSAVSMGKQDDQSSCKTELQLEVKDLDLPCDTFTKEVSGEVSFDITGDSTGCNRKFSISVPCQLEKLRFGTDYGNYEPAAAPSDGLIDTKGLVWFDDGTSGSCNDGSDGIALHVRKFKVPVVKVESKSGGNISVEPSKEDNVTTYTISSSLPDGINYNHATIWDLRVSGGYIQKQVYVMNFSKGLLTSVVKGSSDLGTDSEGWMNTSVTVGECG